MTLDSQQPCSRARPTRWPISSTPTVTGSSVTAGACCEVARWRRSRCATRCSSRRRTSPGWPIPRTRSRSARGSTRWPARNAVGTRRCPRPATSLGAGEFEALELACRHYVDLGQVLGLPAGEAEDLLDRARQNLERALGAEVLAGRGPA